MARVLALLVVVLAVLAGTTTPASAHATLVSTDPAEGEVLPSTPDVVTFTFDEAVSLPADAVQAFDAAGEAVGSEASAQDDVIVADLPDDLDDGTYVVVWRAVSADGHPIAGSLTFSIGAASAEVVAPDVTTTEPTDVRTALSVVQAAAYIGLLVSAGLVLFLSWTLRGVRVDTTVRRRLGAVLWAAAGVTVLAGVAGLPLNGAYQQGLGLHQLGETAALAHEVIGDHLLVLLTQVAGLAIALGNLDRWRVAVAGAALAALSPAAVGHSRAVEPVWLLVTTDVLHLAAGAAWVGGLVGLVLVLRSLSGRERDAALVLARFSLVAGGLLALLTVTGTLMGWRILGGWAPLVDTSYGRLLLVKVAIAGVVAAVAGWNRWRLLPRAVEGIGHGERRTAVLGVRGAVSVEAALLVVLLGLTGFLTSLSPVEGAESRPPVASRVEVAPLSPTERTKVLATMVPRTTGPTTITVQVQDESGEPFDPFTEPLVSVTSVDGTVDLGEQAVVPVSAGTYVVETVIPRPGRWEVQVSVRASEFDNPVATVEFEVS